MNDKLDVEWIALILKAKQIGLTPSEVSEFLKGKQGKKINELSPTLLHKE